MAKLFAEYIGWKFIDAADFIFFAKDGTLDRDKTFAAAEKIFWREGEGVDKKAWVLEFLANKGIQIDAESLDVLIEAAVCKLPEYFDVSAELTETEGGAAEESEAEDENSE